MIGQVVLHRLAEQYTLAVIAAEHTPDDVDLRAWALYADGHIGEVTIPHVQRGPDVDQWQEPPVWPAPAPEPVVIERTPPTPPLAHVQAELMPASLLPSVPRMPLMVIIRHS